MANLANTVCYPDGREPPNHVLEGVFQGMSEFSGCAWHGMHTAIRQPVRYAAREGLFGAGKGIVVGALGFAESLADGALDMASYLVEGVRNTPDALADYVVGEDRKHFRHLVDHQEGRMLETYLNRQPRHLPDGVVLGSRAISTGLVAGTSSFIAKNTEALDEVRDLRSTAVDLGKGFAMGVTGFTVKAGAASLDFTEALVDGARNTPTYVRHTVSTQLDVGHRFADRGLDALVNAAHKAGALERAVKEQGANVWRHRPKLELNPLGAPAPSAPSQSSGAQPGARVGAQRTTSPMGRTLSEAQVGRTPSEVPVGHTSSEATMGRMRADLSVGPSRSEAPRGRTPRDGAAPAPACQAAGFGSLVTRQASDLGGAPVRKASKASSAMAVLRQVSLPYSSEDSSGMAAANPLHVNSARSTGPAWAAVERQLSGGGAGAAAAAAAPEQVRTVLPPAQEQVPEEVQVAPATVIAVEPAAQAPVALSVLPEPSQPEAPAVLPAPSQPARPEPVPLDTMSEVTMTSRDRESTASALPTRADYAGLGPRGEWELAAARQFAIPVGMVFPPPARELPRRLQNAGFGAAQAEDAARAQAWEHMQMYAQYQPGYAVPRASVADGSAVSRWS